MTMLEGLRQFSHWQPVRKGVSVVAGGALLLAPTACSNPLGGNRPEITAPAIQCVEATAQDLMAVGDIFGQPESQERRDLAQNYPNNIEQGFVDLKAAAAERHGLTVFNYPEIFRDLTIYLQGRNGEEIPFNTYFEKSKEFLALYGIDLSFDDKVSEVTHPLDKTKLETREAKVAMYSLLSSIGQLPVELIQYAGLKRVVLAGINNPEVAGFAITSGEHDTYYADPNKLTTENGFNHELYHLIDARQCGTVGMTIDLAYSALNPTNIYKDHTGYLTYDEYGQLTQDLRFRRYYALIDADMQLAEELQRQIDEVAAKVVVMEGYSYKNKVEDKATIGGDLLNPDHYMIFLKLGGPTLKAKFILLMGRIYHDKPGIVRYFADIGHR